MSRRSLAVLVVCGLAAVMGPDAEAVGDDVLHVGAVTVDRPTIVTAGVQLFVSGDDNHNAHVAVRYRAAGTTEWRAGLPLFRVHPEDVVGRVVAEQFAGSIFDLTPATTYDIELRATDPDGPVDQTVVTTTTTRAVPAADPQNPTHVPVTNASELQTALTGAQPGRVIDIADGIYNGQFVILASGTASNPIVIRGASRDGTVLDGNGCGGCNVVEVYGSNVIVENLTLQHATRAIRFQGAGTERNVLRRVHIRDVTLGIGSKADQRDFTICDNIMDGRLAWPKNYATDNGAHSDDDGINVSGTGHVVCHNRISGFGDAMKFGQDGARAVDFYGNEVLSAYDNGFEFDGSEGNVRAFRNRFTNTYGTLSFQPVYGGPVYAMRNVVVNVADEQLKLHGLGTTPPREPNGVLVYNNTFVSPHALNLQTTATSHHFVIANNLFVGADQPGKTVDWSGPIDDGEIDFNGWFPNNTFDFDDAGSWTNFAAMQAAGVFEANGVLLATPVFASGLVAPTSATVTMLPADVTLAPTSNAIDAATTLPNVNGVFTGAAPDLGALERDCPLPLFGVRPDGIDETNEPTGCGGPTVTQPSSPTGVRTTSMTLRDPGAANLRKILFTASTTGQPILHRVLPPAPGTSGDPRLSGASLTVYNAAGSAQKVVVDLPANGWKLLTGGRYKFTSSGPITSLEVRLDRLTVTGGGALWDYTLTAPTQGRVALRLDIGTAATWCASAPAKIAASDHPGLFVARPKSPPPTTCPAVP